MTAFFVGSYHFIFSASSASTIKLAWGNGLSGLGNPCRNGFVVSTLDDADSADEPCLWVWGPDPSEVGAVEPEGAYVMAVQDSNCAIECQG